MNEIVITWHGHSCFTVSAAGYSIVLDPYAPGSVPGYPALALTASQTLCSHEHKDHGYTDAVTIVRDGTKNPFHISKIETFHDDAGGTLRGSNTIHILEYNGLRIAHMGDIGCELTKEQAEQLKNLDAIMIPVGGYYTIDAAQAKAMADALSPRVVIPMHYRSGDFGYPVLSELSDFTSLCSDVIQYNTDTIAVSKETKPQTAVLRYI